MKRIVLLMFLLMFLLIACESTPKISTSDHSKKVTSANPSCDTGVFKSNDSAGLVIGTILQVEDTSSMGGTVIVVLQDKNKKDRQFHGYYSKTKGLEIKSLKSGRCIEIDYYADVEREDGVEVSRLFNINEIRYISP